MTSFDFIPVPLLAVHISANVLSLPWLVMGFAGMFALLAIGLIRLKEEEISRIGLMTAALFVASSIHIPIGPTSVHLLLNGLAGVILGWRVCLAIPVGLLLQAFLLGHGDVSTLGVNSCVMILPALLARPLFRTLLDSRQLGIGEACLAVSCLLDPWSLIVTGPAVYAAKRLHRRLAVPRAFQAGFVIGAGTVFLTSVFHSLALALGGIDDWSVVAVLSLTMHVPVAIVEGAIVGAAMNLLLQVKPSLLVAPSAVEGPVFIQAERPRPAALPTAPVPH